MQDGKIHKIPAAEWCITEKRIAITEGILTAEGLP